METTPPFELSALRRDWIDGLEGRLFYQRVLRRLYKVREAGIAAHRRGVLIAETDPVKFAAAFLAAVHLRRPVILANPRWGKQEWKELRQLVNPALIFGKTPLSTRKRKGPDNPGPSTILIPTGGSTGGVKLTVHRWSTLKAACDGLEEFMGEGPMHCCCVLPLFHVSGLMQLMRSFHTGGRIAFPDFDALRVGRFPDFERNSLCISLVPTQLQRLLSRKRATKKLSYARAVFMGGAPMPDSLAAEARKRQIPIIMSYGMTETAAMIVVQSPDEFLAGAPIAGYPLNHVQVEVIDEAGEACHEGEHGRIRVSGRSLFKGYHGLKRLSLRHGFLTDDEGLFDAKGRLQVIGRADRLIITGGEKVDPREVENAILETGGAQEVLVIGWPHPDWGQQVVAFYTTGGVVSGEDEWGRELSAELAHYKIPKIIFRVPKLPLNSRGKLDHKSIEHLLSKEARIR
ncbi:MAG: AMP-binding protein [Verrucomicrobiota bacterium]